MNTIRIPMEFLVEILMKSALGSRDYEYVSAGGNRLVAKMSEVEVEGRQKYVVDFEYNPEND
jgi:hypothetical protein